MKALLGIALLAVSATGPCFAAPPSSDAPNGVQQVQPAGAEGETAETVMCVAAYFEVRDRYPKSAPGYEAYMGETSFWIERMKKLIPDPAKAQSSVLRQQPFLQAVKDASPTAVDALVRDCERSKQRLLNG